MAEFPRESSTCYISHAEVHRRLSELGEALGTSNANGRVARENYLGIQVRLLLLPSGF